MLTKRTIVDQIEVTRNNSIQVRIAFEIIEDNKVISSKFHRTVIDPDVGVRDQIKVVNEHITGINMNENPVNESDISKIEAIKSVI